MSNKKKVLAEKREEKEKEREFAREGTHLR
jgi:hypothetical protein